MRHRGASSQASARNRRGGIAEFRRIFLRPGHPQLRWTKAPGVKVLSISARASRRPDNSVKGPSVQSDRRCKDTEPHHVRGGTPRRAKTSKALRSVKCGSAESHTKTARNAGQYWL